MIQYIAVPRPREHVHVYMISLTLLMRTATTAALQIVNTHKEACRDSQLLVMYYVSVC